MKMITKDWIRDYIGKKLEYIKMDDIRKVLDKNNIKYKKSSQKYDLVKVIKDNKVDLFEFKDYVGLTRKDLKEIFCATDRMIKKMQDTEFVKIKYIKRVNIESVYGKVNMNFYDIDTIYKITSEQYDKWLKANKFI